MARHVGQVPLFYNHKPSARRGYLFEGTEPLFPFGHGLSYTTFRYANLRLSSARMPVNGRTSVSVEVTNTGSRDGEEVVQLYVRDVVSRATRPVMELRGFSRVAIRAGEMRTVTFALGREHLAYHDPAMRQVEEPGQLEVMVGGSSVQVSKVMLDVTPAAGRR